MPPAYPTNATARVEYVAAFPAHVTGLDEAITIAAALQHAGWRHVIGALWTIWDSAAATIATIATSVSNKLVTGSSLDPTHSAHALHHASRQLRNTHPTRPSTWAPFIHTGP